MIYIIDHNDSFTFNVVHQFSKFDEVICENYDRVNNDILEKAGSIVLSPGPGNPKNYPKSSKIYKRYKGQKKNNWDLFRFSANTL
jgi:anthranilate/para-aminobenzoate synthase component II